MDSNVSADERTHQPRPHGPLVIRGVAVSNPALVASSIAGMMPRERTQSNRSEKFVLYHIDQLPRALHRKHCVLKARGDDLVGTNRSVVNVTIHRIVKVSS